MFNKYAQGPQQVDTLNVQHGAQLEGLNLSGIEGSDFSGLGAVSNSGNTNATTFNLGAQPQEQQSGLGAAPAQAQQQAPVNVVVPPAPPAPTQMPQSALGGTPIRGAASTRGWAF